VTYKEVAGCIVLIEWTLLLDGCKENESKSAWARIIYVVVNYQHVPAVQASFKITFGHKIKIIYTSQYYLKLITALKNEMWAGVAQSV
jgi:hypothetical protein